MTDWLDQRRSCETNREEAERLLAQVYSIMGWPKFEYVIWRSSPSQLEIHAGNTWDRGGNYRRELQQRFRDNPRTDFWFTPLGINATNYYLPGPQLDPPGRNRQLSFEDTELLQLLEKLFGEIITGVFSMKVPQMLEKPAEIHLNEQEQMHREDGPALLWRNGFRKFYWNGVEVSRRFIEVPPTVSYINKQRNTERRRVLMERFGYEKYLRAVKAQIQDESEYGKLWRVPGRSHLGWRGGYYRQIRREDTVLVEVQNATAEPDGTYRTYFLRVPPRFRTAKQAVAWTFRTSDKKYTPKVQS